MSDDRRGLGVAMVAACPFPANHGSPASIREMSQALQRRGHRVHIVSYPMRQEIPIGDLAVHRAGNFLRSRPVTVGPTVYRPLLDLLMVFTLVRVIRRERLEIIHAHNYEGALVGFAAKVLTRRPLLYNAVNTMQDELPSYGAIRPKFLAHGLARLLDNWVPRGADQVTVVSEELREFLAGRGVPPERITLVPAGVNPEMFDGWDRKVLRDRLGVGDAPLVGYTGVLDEFQRVDYLLRAMALVAQRVGTARLALGANLAKTSDVERLRRQAEALGISDRLSIVAPLDLSDLPAFLAALDVAVLPRPACPGFPVKLLNYLAARKPVVSFEGSAKGLKHLDTAYVVPDHDWQGMAQGIIGLLEDPLAAASMAERGRAVIAGRLDWPSLAERVEGLYLRMLGTSAA